MIGRRALGGYRRTILAALVSSAAFVASSAVPLAGTGTAQQSAVIDNGKANAAATVFSISPRTGSLAFALTSGVALAETIGGLAQASAQSVDLGLIGSSLTDEACNGDDPPLRPDQLPQPTQIDNRSGPASAEDADAPISGTNLGVGVERVSADGKPSSVGTVSSVAANLDPLLRVGGGRSTAEAEVFGTTGREARARVEVDLSIAGVVNLTGMRWTARHRTGDKSEAEAGFGIGALELLGVPIPADKVEPAAELINATLKPLGFRIEVPHVERITDPVDLIRVTPLRLLIADSASGAAVRPALELTQKVRYNVATELQELYCRTADVLLVGEITLGVVSGIGSLVLEVGGAEARSANVVYEDPFAHDEPAIALPIIGPVLPTPAVPAAPGAPPRAPANVNTAPVVTVAPTPVVFGERCESTHPDSPRACSRGDAGLVGALGVLATFVVGLADLRRRRRRSAEVVAA